MVFTYLLTLTPLEPGTVHVEDAGSERVATDDRILDGGVNELAAASTRVDRLWH
jgi:hypothetical protein